MLSRAVSHPSGLHSDPVLAHFVSPSTEHAELPELDVVAIGRLHQFL